jgi:hypothetical protein
MPELELDVVGRAPLGPGAGKYDLVDVAAAMRSLAQRVGGDVGDRAPLDAFVGLVAERVPGARWVSVSALRSGRFTTSASTAEQAVRADVLQYEIGSGPCVDAVLKESLYVTGEVSTDTRWAEWGRRANSQVGINSVLSQRLQLQGQDEMVAGLNIYSDVPRAFDRAAVGVALILATHGAMVLSQQLASREAGHLERALISNREIGMAMGIVMSQYRLTRQGAFDVLRVASQNSNRKLADIAAEVTHTGTLTIDQVSRNDQLPMGRRPSVQS